MQKPVLFQMLMYSRLSRRFKTDFTQHCIEASKTDEAVLPQLLGPKQIPIITRFKMKWTSLKCFSHVFHWQTWCSKSCHANRRNFPIVYLHMYAMYGNEHCHFNLELGFKLSNIVSNSVRPCSACGAWQILRSQTNVLSPFMQSGIIVLLLINEEFYVIWWVWKVSFAVKFWNKNT